MFRQRKVELPLRYVKTALCCRREIQPVQYHCHPGVFYAHQAAVTHDRVPVRRSSRLKRAGREEDNLAKLKLDASQKCPLTFILGQVLSSLCLGQLQLQVTDLFHRRLLMNRHRHERDNG